MLATPFISHLNSATRVNTCRSVGDLFTQTWLGWPSLDATIAFQASQRHASAFRQIHKATEEYVLCSRVESSASRLTLHCVAFVSEGRRRWYFQALLFVSVVTGGGGLVIWRTGLRCMYGQNDGVLFAVKPIWYLLQLQNSKESWSILSCLCC